MKITVRDLDLVSLDYSREFDVRRSLGCHLMQVVHHIAQTSGIEKRYEGNLDLEPYATAGFIWEHVMSRTDRLEHAMSIEAIRMEMTHRPELEFPGEQFWCADCDRFMLGGRKARKHCRRRGHMGIFYTPDAYDTVRQAYVEWKFTWKSSRRSEAEVLNSKDGIWRWPVQCMWNCLGLGTNKAILTALHCNGDYSFGLPKPVPREITLEFTDKELRRNKRMIVSNARSMGWI